MVPRISIWWSELRRGATAYTEWVFDPAEIDVESSGFGYANVTTLLDSGAKSTSELESYYGAMFGDRLSVEDIEYLLTMNQFVILSGDVDGAALAKGLNLSSDGEYRDFTVFTDGSGFLLAESTDYVLAGAMPTESGQIAGRIRL